MSGAGTLPGTTYGPDSDARDFLFNRVTEAQRIAEFIVTARRTGAQGEGASPTKMVLLSGRASSGKTTLVQRWLIPELRQREDLKGYTIFYGQCAPKLPGRVADRDRDVSLHDALRGRSIVIIDEFDQVLAAPREERRRQLDDLFAALHRSHDDAIVVPVVSIRQLTSTYALNSYDPRIATTVCSVQSVGIVEGLMELTVDHGDPAEAYSRDLLHELTVDEQKLEAGDLDVTFDLVRLLHERFSRLRREENIAAIDKAHYERIGRLSGVLREHLNRQLDQLASGKPGLTDKLGRAVLLCMRESQRLNTAPDLDEVAARFDVGDERVREVLTALAAPGGLLQATGPQLYEFVPPQLAVVVDEEAESNKLLNDRAVRTVQDGLRAWQLTGTYLAESRFAELHGRRRHLIVDDELTRFLLRCALRAASADLDDAARYWAGRIRQPEDAVDVLLSETLERDARVRRRAAALLGRYHQPSMMESHGGPTRACEKLVRERLALLALTDSTDDVRHAAVASLDGLADEPLLNRLLGEVKNPNSTVRDNAVYALRLYRRDHVTAALKWLVNETATPEALRAQAVSVLAALNTPDAIDTLVDIAMNDDDEADRRAAAAALAKAESKELNEQILTRLDWRRSRTLLVLAQAGLGSLLVVASFVAMRLAEVWLINRVGVVLVVLAVPASLLLSRLRDGRLRLRSAWGAAGIVLFGVLAVTIAPLVHGLAHALIRRWKRALSLFALELLALLVFFVVADFTAFVPAWGDPLALTYRVLGAALFLATYLWDVLGVTRVLFVLRRAAMRDARRAAIYDQVFRNPAMADAVFDDLRDADEASARRARKLIRRYGPQIPAAYLVERFFRESAQPDKHLAEALVNKTDEFVVSQMEKRFGASDERRRRAIVSILAAMASERSTNALTRIGRSAGFAVRARTAWTRLRFRLGVWPWPVHLAGASLIPLLGVIFYHGWMLSQNPAWAQILQLRESATWRSERQGKIVTFLADAFPTESSRELRLLFREGYNRPVTPRHASLAAGLAGIHDQAANPEHELLRAALDSQLPRFDTLLASRDSTDFELGLGVMRAVADISDSTLAYSAIGALLQGADSLARAASRTADAHRALVAERSVTIDRARGDSLRQRIDSVERVSRDFAHRKRLVIDGLGGLPYRRALPALDSVLRIRPTGKPLAVDTLAARTTRRLQRQITEVARQAYGSIPTGATQRRNELLALLKGLSYQPTEVVTQLEHDASGDAGGCDRNRDSKCDRKDDALAYIARHPTSETAYRSLFEEFAADSQFADASVVFDGLIKNSSSSVWARKVQAEIYHEFLAPKDDSYFASSYDQMVELRALRSYAALRSSAPDDHERVEADFVETALSARRFAVADRAARAVLAATKDDVFLLNMTLFLYMSAVQRLDYDSSMARLDELERVVNGLPERHYNGWRYPGTVASIRRSNLAPMLKTALERLCKEGTWYDRSEAAEIIAYNRSALQATLSPRRTPR